jgi:hypothetical protein
MGLKSLSGYAPLLKEIKDWIQDAQYWMLNEGSKMGI